MLDFLSGLGAVVWDWDPVLIHLGSFQLRYYGILFALALAVGYMTLRWRYKDENEDPELATNLTYALMIAVVVGARLAHCFFYEPERYLSNPAEIIAFWRGGLASHGAAAGMMLVCIAYDRFWRHTPLRVTLDRLAFCIPFAMICVRLGNFFNSEIVGAPCDPESPVAFIFTRYDMVARYPSQLFEVGMGIIAGIAMFGMYAYYKKRNKPRPLGLSASLILVLYFGMRFCVEFFKEYQVEDNIGGLREGQILSIPFLIIGLIGIVNCLWGSWKNQNVLQFTKAYQLPAESDKTPEIAAGGEDNSNHSENANSDDTASADAEDNSNHSENAKSDDTASADAEDNSNHSESEKSDDTASANAEENSNHSEDSKDNSDSKTNGAETSKDVDATSESDADSAQTRT